MGCTVADVARIVEEWAPLALCEEGDNCGLLAGLSVWPVEAVLVSLDVDESVLGFAAENRFDMVVAHHPFLYRPISSVTDASAAGRLAVQAVCRGVAVYAAHTNLDRAPGGVNDELCRAVGLPGALPAGEGSFGWLARLGAPAELDGFARHIRQALGAPAVRVTGQGGKLVRTVYAVSGSGRREIARAARAGADCLLTGEISYHDAQEASALGLSVVEAGHYHTEAPVLRRMEKHLQSQFQRLQYTVRTAVYEVSTCPFRYLDG